ncbi:hypothetical protein LCGC14_2625450 [marine sediment metagenome]|uniref:Uncharacterized protein n=1 Tax=marine sediment metagenome TaxID=412755 RepID=A0A0F9A1S9_9ZZZZ
METKTQVVKLVTRCPESHCLESRRVGGDVRARWELNRLAPVIEKMDGRIEDFAIIVVDKGLVLAEVSDGLCRWDYVSLFTISPFIEDSDWALQEFLDVWQAKAGFAKVSETAGVYIEATG